MKQFFKKLSAKGFEILDTTPVSIPLGFRKPKSITEQIAEFVSNERIRERLESAGLETFEDAEDFDIGDDYEVLPESKYEADFDNIKSGLALQREKARAQRQSELSKPAAGAPKKEKVKPEQASGLRSDDEVIEEE